MTSTTAPAANIAAVPLYQRLMAGGLALLLGLVLITGTGLAGDFRLHNGAHDTRHAMGFPCH